MELDTSLAKEIKKLNGNTREARFALIKKIESASEYLSQEVDYDRQQLFDSSFSMFGRAVIALVIASTIYQRRDRIDYWKYDWAVQVLSLWTNRGSTFVSRAEIRDHYLHPTKICIYAKEFIDLTSY